MTSNYFRFSIRQLLACTLAIAGASALVVSFGNHFLWASKHAIVQRYSALAKIDNSRVASDCELTNCRVNGLSFDVPTSMVGTARIIRSSSTDIWLAFEDATRMMQVSLVPNDMRTALLNVPRELEDLSTPSLLEKSISTASEDFSFLMRKDELRIHNWAIETRRVLNLDSQHMDRYSLLYRDDIEAILISADPASIDSSRRLRSILFWESKDRQNHGSIWFANLRNSEANWIDSVAKSVAMVSSDMVASDRLTPAELAELDDAEILSQLNIADLQAK
ncbi:MAG: hypothetical protein R3C53_02985 [Pirellulaceae bacterium]